MALEATHVRFAHDLASVLEVRDIPTYLAGCVYPDSRYVTGLKRPQTHGNIPTPHGLGDFEKGWFVHLLYDELVGPCYLHSTPYAGQRVVAEQATWIHMTAAKIIEDQQACGALSVSELFSSIHAPVDPPYQENAEALERYYSLLQELYRAAVPTVDEYRALLSVFGVTKATEDALIYEAHRILSDEKRCAEIVGFYYPAVQEGVDRARRFLEGNALREQKPFA